MQTADEGPADLRKADREGVEKVFLEHLSFIEDRLEHQAQRSSFSGEVAEDFSSWAKMRLIEDGYRRLRAFKGRSRFTSFLTVVIANLVHDYRNHIWGRYRPSAAAKRMGAQAVELECLLVRDGLSENEAVAMLLSEGGVPQVHEEELRELASQLSQRQFGRTFVGTEELAELEAPNTDPGSEAQRRSQSLELVLDAALAGISAQDFLILKMIFGSGKSVADAARALRLDQASLYRRRDRSLAKLRRHLTESGFDWSEVREVLNWQVVVDSQLTAEDESEPAVEIGTER